MKQARNRNYDLPCHECKGEGTIEVNRICGHHCDWCGGCIYEESCSVCNGDGTLEPDEVQLAILKMADVCEEWLSSANEDDCFEELEKRIRAAAKFYVAQTGMRLGL